jgi:hypothetical protein
MYEFLRQRGIQTDQQTIFAFVHCTVHLIHSKIRSYKISKIQNRWTLLGLIG